MGSSGTGIRHIIQNCVAWKNKASGFYANHSSGGNTWDNNTAYQNGTQYNMLASSFAADGRTIATAVIILTGTKVHIMRNNIGFPNKNSNMTGVDTASNTWDLGITEAATDFASTSDTGCTGPREADGSLPSACQFLKLKAGSPLIDKGVDVGLPFVGAAPDLGAYEYGAVTTTGGTSGGSGGSTGAGGSTGSSGRGGSVASGGSLAAGGSTAAGGRMAAGGSTTGASTARGGSIASGGSMVAGGSMTGGGGVPTAGTSGAIGGASATGGSVATVTGGAAGGIITTGGASQDTGGSLAATGGTSNEGGAGAGGVTGPSATGGSTAEAAASTSGCGCVVGSRSPRDGMGVFLMLGALALLVRQRRNRS
jgi:MYXO-CTERM domain-containing protein